MKEIKNGDPILNTYVIVFEGKKFEITATHTRIDILSKNLIIFSIRKDNHATEVGYVPITAFVYIKNDTSNKL